MSRTRILRPARITFAALTTGGAISLYPSRIAHAEGPPPSADEPILDKKPVYSDYPLALPKQTPSRTSPNPAAAQPTSPTPTDRLTAQIQRGRLALYKLTTAAEDTTNDALTWAFKKETNIANTVACLAPAPQTGEQLLPGAIYVLVATLAGSIVSRNRGIFLRAATPLGVGITAGWMLIPVTMTNIGDLMWEYERKVPAISETHSYIRGFAVEAWRQAKIRGSAAADRADRTAESARRGVEGWVEKGK